MNVFFFGFRRNFVFLQAFCVIVEQDSGIFNLDSLETKNQLFLMFSFLF